MVVRWKVIHSDLVRDADSTTTTPSQISTRYGMSRERARQILIKMEEHGLAEKSSDEILKRVGARVIRRGHVCVRNKGNEQHQKKGAATGCSQGQ